MPTTAQNFSEHVKSTEEIGYVEQVLDSIVYSSGLPSIHPEEVVLFETGEIGQVLSVTPTATEILLFSPNTVRVGTRVTGTRVVVGHFVQTVTFHNKQYHKVS